MKKRLSAVLFAVLFYNIFIYSEPLNICVVENSPVSLNYYFRNDNNDIYQFSGLNKFVADNGFEINIEIYSEQKAVKYLEQGKEDLIYGVQKSPDYENRFAYSNFPCSYGRYFLIALLDNKKYFAGSFPDIGGETVGILKNDVSLHTLFEKKCVEKNLHPQLIEYYAETAMINDLYKGKIDLILQNTNQLMDSEKVIYYFDSVPLYFMMNKNNRKLQKLINDNSGQLVLHSAKGITSGLYENVTAEEYEFIKKGNVIPVCVDNGTTRENYTSASNHSIPKSAEKGSLEEQLLDENLNKIYVKYFDQIKQISGLNFKAADHDDKNISGDLISISVPDLFSGSSEVAPVENIIQKASVWVITAPSVHISLFEGAPKKATSRKIKLAVVNESLLWLPFFKSRFHSFETEWYSDIRSCLKAVNTGECDAMVVPDYFLNTIYDLSRYINLKKCTPYYYEIPIKMFVKGRNKNIIASVLNKAQEQMKADYVGSLFRRNEIYNFYDSTKANVTKQRSNEAIILVVIIAIVIIFYVFHSLNQYKKWALRDSLTGMWNDRYFNINAKKMLDQNKSSNYALIYINIRGFKNINFIKGLKEGDEELKKIALALKKYESKDCLPAKGVGDSFYILMKVESEKTGINLCRQILQEFKDDKILKASNSCLKFGISFGGRDYDCYSIKKLSAKANYALKRARGSLVVPIEIFDNMMQAEFNQENFIEASLPSAFANKEFYVVFQPKVDLVTGRIVGGEALVRWQHLGYNMLLPDEFIPVMERNGSILDLDFYVYERVFEYIQSLLDEGIVPPRISLNMSRLHLNSDIFVDKIMKLFSKFSIPVDLIEIEVVERSSGEGDKFLHEIANKLHALGIGVSMDDFGTGESSLNMFTELPIDVIKFDQKFMSDRFISEKRKQLISAMTGLAKKFGQKTVCEGVWDGTQVEFLRSIGCDIVQGFYYYKPLPADEFKKLIKAGK